MTIKARLNTLREIINEEIAHASYVACYIDEQGELSLFERYAPAWALRAQILTVNMFYNARALYCEKTGSHDWQEDEQVDLYRVDFTCKKCGVSQSGYY